MNAEPGRLGSAPKTGPKQRFWMKSRDLPTLRAVHEGGGGLEAEDKYVRVNTPVSLAVSGFGPTNRILCLW